MKHFWIYILIGISLPSAKAFSLEYEWTNFKTNFNKSYKTPQEELKRFKTFSDRLQFIKNHNGNEKMFYKIGVNGDIDSERTDSSNLLKTK